MAQLHIPSPYQPVCLLGKGRFGDVYLVKERASALYACKTAASASARAILRREAAIQREIEHPLFAGFHELLENDTGSFQVMEYIQGISLAQMRQTQPRISEETVLTVAIALAEGLYYLHNRPEPILYRDLKPEHVILTKNGVRLLDLGCACLLSEADASRAGTPGFAAPEQLPSHLRGQASELLRTPQGELPDGRAARQGKYSDIYALGRLLEFMLGKGEDAGCYSGSGVQNATGIRDELRQMITCCIMPDPAQRIPDLWPVLYILRSMRQPLPSTACKSRQGEKGRSAGKNKNLLGCYRIQKSVCLAGPANRAQIGQA